MQVSYSSINISAEGKAILSVNLRYNNTYWQFKFYFFSHKTQPYFIMSVTEQQQGNSEYNIYNDVK